jgi:hypothetical protein
MSREKGEKVKGNFQFSPQMEAAKDRNQKGMRLTLLAHPPLVRT